MKLGFFTDVHARGDSPESRTDNFLKSLLTKLEEVGDIFKEHSVDYILFGGDLSHTPDITHGVVNKLLKILIKWKLPIIGVVGSHDYVGYQKHSLDTTALGVLVNAGVIKLVGYDDSSEFINLGGVTITGTPHTYDLVDDIQHFYKPRYIPENIQIQLVHGDLLDKPGPPKWPHVTCQQVVTESDLVLSGHYHPGWEGGIVANGTVFLNPGSIGRLERTPRIRIPGVYIIDTKETTVYNNVVMPFRAQYISLSSALEYPFSEKSVIRELEPVEDIRVLMRLIENSKITAVDIEQQLPRVGKAAGFADDVIEVAFSILKDIK